MNRRRLVSREIGVGATPVLTGHAGIAHNHDPLGGDVRVSRSGKARAQGEGRKSKRESSNNGKPERSLSLPAIVVRDSDSELRASDGATWMRGVMHLQHPNRSIRPLSWPLSCPFAKELLCQPRV